FQREENGTSSETASGAPPSCACSASAVGLRLPRLAENMPSSAFTWRSSAPAPAARAPRAKREPDRQPRAQDTGATDTQGRQDNKNKAIQSTFSITP